MKIVLAGYAAISSLKRSSDSEVAGDRAVVLSCLHELGAGVEAPLSWVPDLIAARERGRLQGPVVITTLPETMGQLKKEPGYGLASANLEGRRHAIADLRKAIALCASEGFDALEFHSGPGSADVESDRECLTRSLTELASGEPVLALLLEHCDRFRADGKAGKGFVDLDSEIEAIQESGASRFGVRMAINWGRSALEGRSAQTPLDQLRLLKKEGLLGGFVLSGVCEVGGLYGNWADSHAPLGQGVSGRIHHPGSLLSQQRARECVMECQHSGLPWIGAKIQVLPETLPLEERLNWLREAHRFLGEF